MGQSQIVVFSDPFNKRIRVDDYNGELVKLEKEVSRETISWTEKIIIKARASDLHEFIRLGYLIEGIIPRYFINEDMYFVTRYLSNKRQVASDYMEQQKILNNILTSAPSLIASIKVEVKEMSESDAPGIADLFKKHMRIYPSPLYDPAYVRRTILNGTKYKAILDEEQLVSIASAEINFQYKNAEITDCLTVPGFRGKNLMLTIIRKLEEELERENFCQIYSLARARSIGMNKVFYNLGYTYGGCLVNNCFIGSGLEDMNIWYKNK